MSVEREVIDGGTFGSYSVCHHSSGLDVLVWKMDGFTTTNAVFGTKYGSVNTRFRTVDTGEFIDVPDGIAHYLEHKLFENEDSDVFSLFAPTGASANAFTTFNVTAYTFGTSGDWEKPLEILLDFVRKPYFTDENVQKERGIIAQEIKMSQDSPDRACYFNLLRALYHYHPVRIDIAGTVESIQEITPELLYKCYNTFYNLRNMVLCIAGNVDEQKVIEICDKMLTPAPDIKLETAYPDEPADVAQKRITACYEVANPLFAIGIKFPPFKGMQLLRYEICAGILMRMIIGDMSPLFKELLEEGLINSSNFGLEIFNDDCGVFACICRGDSKDPDKVLEKYIARIDELKRTGLDEKLFERVRKLKYGLEVRSLSDVDYCVENMFYNHISGLTAFDTGRILSELTFKEVEDAFALLFDTSKAAISIIEKENAR